MAVAIVQITTFNGAVNEKAVHGDCEWWRFAFGCVT
ncbi:hypothetical protein N788_08180 [Arenimonas donghaensis DSM 18148 = HO3-R19]|uniref:Uncharacterized protein n=1 Tax=Arenimonas donghaensis DSM 18148 = HO3-R19 TaxID=1121014 RepID=A0A087MFQ2_9GAMM|nr:hypothetical protein N788_08180 [Arenimonas donghaensis DSM 18148 = HO3-R19]